MTILTSPQGKYLHFTVSSCWYTLKIKKQKTKKTELSLKFLGFLNKIFEFILTELHFYQ